MPSNKDKARASAPKQSISPHEVLKRSRKQESQRTWLIIVSLCTVLLLAIFIPQLSNGTVDTEKSHGLKKKKHLQSIETYGLNSGLPLPRNIATDPCPIQGHNGSKLDCFFADMFFDFQAEDKENLHTDSSLGSQGTYGEITPSGVNMLFELLKVDADDTFYDLGSGTGKVVMQAFLTTPCRRAVGIELSEPRHLTATKARSLILELFNVETQSSRLHFQQGDASVVSFDDATIIFMCSLCFPDVVMRKLSSHSASVAKPGTIVLSLKPFEDNPGLSLFGFIPLPMTWTSRFEMLVYVVAPRLSTLKPLLGQFVATSSLDSWRGMLRASVTEDVRKIVIASIAARTQSVSSIGLNHSIAIENAKFLFGMDGFPSPEGIVSRFFRLANTFANGKLADRTQLAFNNKIKHRSRELAAQDNMQISGLAAGDIAAYALARVQGDSDSILDCILADLWPRVLPKLAAEEAKLAVGPGNWQMEMSPVQLQMMLNLITPPAGKDDVVVEARSGAGQLITQVRMTTSVKKAVGIEAVPSRLQMAIDVASKIKACDRKASSEDTLSCPLALSVLADDGLKNLIHDDNLAFRLDTDPIGAAVNVQGASVIYALTQGFPRGAMWHFATKTASTLPTGAIVVATSMWPGCQRGLLEILSTDLETEGWSAGRHIMSWTASVNMVLPTVDASHPIFSTPLDASIALRDLLFQRFGISEGKGGSWRTQTIPFDKTMEVLLNFGPPFSTNVASNTADETLFHSRFKTMISRYLTEKSRRRHTHDVSNGDVMLQQVVDLLSVALHGDAQSPIECLASDLDILKEHREGKGKDPTKPNTVYANCAASGGLRPLAIADLLDHPALRERFGSNSAAIVVGDCRAAALLLMLRNGPRSVRCLNLKSAVTGYKDPLQDLNISFPGLLHGRQFDQGIASLNPDDMTKSSLRMPGATTVFLLTQCDDAQASQTLVSDLLQGLGNADMLLVSLETMAGKTQLSESLQLSRAWALHPDSKTVTANFYQLPQA